MIFFITTLGKYPVDSAKQQDDALIFLHLQ